MLLSFSTYKLISFKDIFNIFESSLLPFPWILYIFTNKIFSPTFKDKINISISKFNEVKISLTLIL